MSNKLIKSVKSEFQIVNDRNVWLLMDKDLKTILLLKENEC